MIIGVDLDNTLAGYGELFLETAVDMGLVPPGLPPDKTGVRDRVRQDHGDEAWQRLQARVYGPEMRRARLLPGAAAFLRQCRERCLPVHVVSHKTRFARLDETKTDLRRAALGWMEASGLFDQDGPGLAPERVHFEDTRPGKVERIRALGCTDFVDDLEEVFDEPGFPSEVRAYLFGRERTGLSGVVPCPDWDAVRRSLFADNPVQCFDYEHIFGVKVRGRGPLPGGANSRVTALTLEDGTKLVAKHYHRHPDDPRDRMGAEVAALRLLRRAGLDCVPEVVAANRQTGTALFSLVRGEPVSPPYTDDDLGQLLGFLGRLRELSDTAALTTTDPTLDMTTLAPDSDPITGPTTNLITGPTASLTATDQDDNQDDDQGINTVIHRASEACFTLDELAANLAARMERLRRAEAKSACHQGMLDFLADDLEPFTARALDAARSGAAAEPVTPEQRLLSPSDLGFHNALRLPDGSLAFLDMEYFGWDDPAKTVCDVLLHPAMGLTARHQARFLRESVALLAGRRGPNGLLPARVAALYPLYGAKWCLILLNEFVAKDQQRRRLAGACEDPEAACAAQLAKAGTLYQRLDNDHARVRAHLA